MPVQSLVTCEEFERLAARLGPCEFIDGQVRTSSPGGFKHGRTSWRIAAVLDGFVTSHRLGRVSTNELGIHISHDPPRSRGADVIFISFQRLPANREPEGFLTIAPELVVEVLGAKDTWEDISEKIADYHRAGVDMVWVADPYTRTVKRSPRGAEPQIIHEGAALDGGAILPGFSVPVVRFFND
ncbi:MAG: Uma2 family endonuclease [Planctomycetota bacterium]|nr:Uma2 family endonuclease [Planctomycetota bacterium]